MCWLCLHYFKWNTKACNSWYNEWTDIHVQSDHHQRYQKTYHKYDHRYPISFIFLGGPIWFGHLCNIFDNSKSIFFFQIFCWRLSDSHLVCSVGYINGVHLFHVLIAVFFIIVELICSILSHPHINYFIIFTSYFFYKLSLKQLYTVEAKWMSQKMKSIKCKQLVMSVSVTLMVSIWEKWRSPWQPKQLPGSPASPIE